MLRAFFDITEAMLSVIWICRTPIEFTSPTDSAFVPAANTALRRVRVPAINKPGTATPTMIHIPLRITI